MLRPPSSSIAILTFRRPDGLKKALESLLDVAERVGTDIGMTEIVVVDNDAEGSARNVVESIGSTLVRYVHEPRPGVSAARNRALDEATTERLVFIDDDEHAGPNWPTGLLDVMSETGAAMVGGPVRSVLPDSTPAWARSIGVFERDEPADRSELGWLRSGNLAIDLELIRGAGLRFEEAFGSTGGEDVRFSVLAKRRGLGVRWSATAIVYEDVMADRLTADWVVNRALAAMTNYVRAHAPISPMFACRMLVRAGGRLPIGIVQALTGKVLADEERQLAGKVALARANGAVRGIAISLREERVRRHT